MFGPKNSLILAYDEFTPERLDELENEWAEIRKFYRFSPLSEILSNLGKRKSLGKAAVVLKAARKGTVFQVVPALVSLEIPFTLILDTDCIGTNRLPLAEELELYQNHYGLTPAIDAWENPEAAEAFLREHRKTTGPFPVETQSPLRFYSTWGKIIEIPKTSIEFGLSIPHSSFSKEWLAAATRTVLFQTKSAPILALPSGPLPQGSVPFPTLGKATGEITLNSNPENLPVWN